MSTPTLTPDEILRARELLPPHADVHTLAVSVHEIAVHLLRYGVSLVVTDTDSILPAVARARLSRGQRFIATALRILDAGALPPPSDHGLRFVATRPAFDPDKAVELVLADDPAPAPDPFNPTGPLYVVGLDFFTAMVLLSNLAENLVPAASTFEDAVTRLRADMDKPAPGEEDPDA